MLYREDDQFKLMPFKASYDQHGESYEKHVVSNEELEAYEKLGHISNLSFEEAVYTPEQLERLEEVKHLSEYEYAVVLDYVIDGKITEGSSLAALKENKELREKGALLDELIELLAEKGIVY